VSGEYGPFGGQKGWGDVRGVESRSRFGDGTGSGAFFAMLAAVLVLAVALLLAFPARALAAPAVLSIDKEGPSRVEPGQRFDYVLTVSNAADAQPANNVTVEDKLPTGVTFEEFEAPAGVTCAAAAGTVTCNVPNLAAGESKTITLKVRAPSLAGKITNRATASSADDTDSPVASKEVTTTVAPNLVIEKLDDPDPVRTEAILLYTLRVQNQGEGFANGVGVTDALPLDAVDFITVDSADFNCQYKAGVVQCNGGSLTPGEIAKVEIVVEPEKAGTIQNTGAVFAQGVSEPLDTDTESTVVQGGSGGGGNGDGGNGGGGNGGGGPGGIPQGDQCSPVVERGTDETVGVISGTAPDGGTFTNTFSETLPLRIAYATSSEDGSLNITVTPKDRGEAVLDETIKGKKQGVVEVKTKAGVSYDVLILPEDQGYAVKLQIGSGEEPCTDPSDLDPPAVPGDDANDANDDGGTGADDVIDETISDEPLPPTGGPSLPGLAVIALGLAVLGGATVVGTGVRRRDR